MPIHDWTRVDAGIFHDFHHEWIATIKHAVNDRLKGTEYYALAEQVAGGIVPDVLTLKRPVGQKKPKSTRPTSRSGFGVLLVDSPPQVRFRITNSARWYATKKKSVTIRHVSEHNVIAVLEIVSPGNKSSRNALFAFATKAQDLLSAGIHLGVVDLFPPTKRDPQGIHPILWGEEDDDAFQFDRRKPLTCASYVGGPLSEAFVEPVAVGDMLPDLALFVLPQEYVTVPLEATYQEAFEAVPDFWREVIESKN